ncbi:hypothetical protein B0H17DRAFT_1149386 [Mycena rosella]|uniref:Uncharacterized protein n=1 Tax=Mycena rosella TaxID=1033263 RepID=A0AAD7C341_MYCRO|nr:hypothetical protein B0H17DRAFT_1149386 [Mycena rosella]
MRADAKRTPSATAQPPRPSHLRVTPCLRVTPRVRVARRRPRVRKRPATLTSTTLARAPHISSTSTPILRSSAYTSRHSRAHRTIPALPAELRQEPAPHHHPLCRKPFRTNLRTCQPAATQGNGKRVKEWKEWEGRRGYRGMRDAEGAGYETRGEGRKAEHRRGRAGTRKQVRDGRGDEEAGGMRGEDPEARWREDEGRVWRIAFICDAHVGRGTRRRRSITRMGISGTGEDTSTGGDGTRNGERKRHDANGGKSRNRGYDDDDAGCAETAAEGADDAERDGEDVYGKEMDWMQGRKDVPNTTMFSLASAGITVFAHPGANACSMPCRESDGRAEGLNDAGRFFAYSLGAVRTAGSARTRCGAGRKEGYKDADKAVTQHNRRACKSHWSPSAAGCGLRSVCKADGLLRRVRVDVFENGVREREGLPIHDVRSEVDALGGGTHVERRATRTSGAPRAGIARALASRVIKASVCVRSSVGDWFMARSRDLNAYMNRESTMSTEENKPGGGWSTLATCNN